MEKTYYIAICDDDPAYIQYAKDLFLRKKVTEENLIFYEYFSGELDRYLFMIADPEEREEAFIEYKDFLSGYDWDDHPGLFRAMHGIEYGALSSLDVVSYMNAAANLTPRDRVLLEFDAGLIGFKWIIKYLRAWLKYKLKRRF